MSSSEKPGVALEAAARLDKFLRSSVESPLTRGLASTDPDELREAVEAALTAIQGLHFLADRAAGERALHDLSELLAEAVDRFREGSAVPVDLSGTEEPIQVRVDGEAFGDLLFLVLHNAEHFGGGEPIRVSAEAGEPYARVTVEDRGPGFTAEALSRAYDPFYSTSETGLGLGLPQARQLIESMGGAIGIRNGDDGGIVELSIPAA